MPDPKKNDPHRPRRVEITEPTLIGGEHHEPGDVVEVSAADAASIVGAGRGKFVDDDAKLGRFGSEKRRAREAGEAKARARGARGETTNGGETPAPAA